MEVQRFSEQLSERSKKRPRSQAWWCIAFFFLDLLILYVGVFCPCVCICTMYMPGAHRGQKKGSELLELVVPMVCEPSYGFWESNLGPLQKQPVLYCWAICPEAEAGRALLRADWAT